MSDTIAFRPYRPVWVVPPQAAGLDFLPPSATLALEVSPQEEAVIPKEYLPPWINGPQPFLLLLHAPAPVASWSEETAEALGLCLMSPRYLRREGRPVVAVLGITGETIPALEAGLAERGWRNVFLWMFADKAPGEAPPAAAVQPLPAAAPLLIREADLATVDPAALFFTGAAHAGAFVFFKGGDAAGSVALENAVAGACLRALERMGIAPGSPGETWLGHILTAHADALDRAMDAEEAQRVTADRLRSAEVIVSVVRSKYKDDYDALYKWHHSEYTVLPLWYKRFGQVIKVLTGKRTFRSLFRK